MRRKFDHQGQRTKGLPGARIFIALLLSGCMFFGLSACGPKPPSLERLAPLPQGKLCRVAVIPFASETDYPLADLIGYRVFTSELVHSGRFVVSQEGDVREIYRQMKILPGQAPHIEQIKILANRLNAQIVISGTVIEMAESPQQTSVNPSIALSLQILDGVTGQTMWTTYHRGEGENYRKVMHFGLVNTATALARRMSQEVMEMWFREGLKGCEN